MSTYENGESTKALIVDVAEKLFYEKGYEHTSIKDIADASHVAKSSILYHFKSKDELYEHTGYKILGDFFNNTAEKINIEKLRLYIQGYSFWYKLFHDEKFRQYSVDSVGYLGEPSDYCERIYTILKRTYDLEESYEVFEKKNGMIVKFVGAMEDQMILYYSQHLQESTFDQVAELDALLFSRAYGIPEELIQKRLCEARKILPKLDLEKIKMFF